MFSSNPVVFFQVFLNSPVPHNEFEKQLEPDENKNLIPYDNMMQTNMTQ